MPLNIEITQEPLEVTTMLPTYRPDPKWTASDPAGHAHHFVGKALPTLERAETAYWCYDCEDEHTDVSYRCLLCHAEVIPAYLAEYPAWREFIPGMRDAQAWLADGRRWLLIGEEQEQQALAVRGWADADILAFAAKAGWRML